MFTLAIPCLTMSNLPWFMDLTFQVPLKYCHLQNLTLLSPPNTSTAEHHSHFGPAASCFLESLVISLCSSPVAHCTPSYLGALSSGDISFCHFILLMGFSGQEYWSGLPFPPTVDHILLEHSTLTRPPWMALCAWPVALLSYASLFTMTRMWFMKVCKEMDFFKSVCYC